jgi:hypothetical protein
MPSSVKGLPDLKHVLVLLRMAPLAYLPRKNSAQSGPREPRLLSIQVHRASLAVGARLVRRSTKRAPSQVMVCLPIFATSSTIMVVVSSL